MNSIITLDGPAAAGKSTVARQLSQSLGHLYVDSGALYRLVTWFVVQAGVDTENAEAVADAARKLHPVFRAENGRVVAGGIELPPPDALRTPEINRHVSPVSKIQAVRDQVTQWLRSMRDLGNLVVEGRDIGSVVFPDATARFYLDAAPQERARRRFEEDRQRGFSDSPQAVLDSLRNRDQIDSTRVAAPLCVPVGATVIDTTPLSIDAVVEAILSGLPGGKAT